MYPTAGLPARRRSDQRLSRVDDLPVPDQVILRLELEIGAGKGANRSVERRVRDYPVADRSGDLGRLLIGADAVAMMEFGSSHLSQERCDSFALRLRHPLPRAGEADLQIRCLVVEPGARERFYFVVEGPVVSTSSWALAKIRSARFIARTSWMPVKMLHSASAKISQA